MQTTAIRTVANPLPENKIILLTLLISKRYIPYTDLKKKVGLRQTFNTNLTNGRCFYTLSIAAWNEVKTTKELCRELFATINF